MHEEAAKRAKLDIDVPWDELRAARVHKGALEAFRTAHEQDEQKVRERIERGPLLRPRMMLAAAALVAAAAAVLLYLRTDDGQPVAAASWASASTLHYTDGSRSLLSERAKVHVLQDSGKHVHVQQSSGKVRYEITRRPERRFVVGAHDVTITVLGTVFDVAVDATNVVVTVERGRVRVEHGERKLVLTAGQKAELAAKALPPAAPTKDSPEPDSGSDLAADGPDEPTEPNCGGASTAPRTAAGGHGGASAGPTAAELMRRADQARAAGQLDKAATALRELMAKHPRDGRATMARFTLGRIERQRGNHAAAAAIFDQCGAALRGDAYAEAAGAWTAAGQPARARAAAERYLQAYPTGVHAERMRALLTGG